jgi:hypothetical protein
MGFVLPVEKLGFERKDQLLEYGDSEKDKLETIGGVLVYSVGCSFGSPFFFLVRELPADMIFPVMSATLTSSPNSMSLCGKVISNLLCCCIFY